MGNQWKQAYSECLEVPRICPEQAWSILEAWNKIISLPGSYQLECELKPVCDVSNARLCASLIGILQWLVELDRVEIIYEVSMMSSHTTMLREGHLNHAL